MGLLKKVLIQIYKQNLLNHGLLEKSQRIDKRIMEMCNDYDFSNASQDVLENQLLLQITRQFCILHNNEPKLTILHHFEIFLPCVKREDDNTGNEEYQLLHPSCARNLPIFPLKSYCRDSLAENASVLLQYSSPFAMVYKSPKFLR